MYELKRTQARTAFKDLLGQANHFLITILIGLNGVRTGQIKHDPEFHAAWNPKNPVASADRSRLFALDLALVRGVDALDRFMMLSRRAPSTLGSPEFEREMDSTGPSVRKRLGVFLKYLPGLSDKDSAFLRLAIAWRNIRVHSLSEEDLDNSDEAILMQSSQALSHQHNGLIVEDLMKRFKAAQSPAFKEAASIINLIHKAVEHFDRNLLQVLNIEIYIRDALRAQLSKSEPVDPTGLRYACKKIWGNADKRRSKAMHILKFAGVHAVDTVTAREVPIELVERIATFEPEEAISYLTG